MGTTKFGTRIAERDAHALLDAFASLGGNFIDTANNYGDSYGVPRAAERVIGTWLRRRGADVLIGTKAGYNWAGEVGVGLDPRYLESELERSLDALGVSEVEVFWLHRDDQNVPLDELCDALDRFVRAGRVRLLGCSNWTIERIVSFQRQAERSGATVFSAIQPLWSLATRPPGALTKGLRQFDDHLRDYCLSSGLVVVPYRTLARGFFANSYKEGAPLPGADSASKVELEYFSAVNFRRKARAQQLAERHGVSATAICLSYLLSQRAPTLPIIGCHAASQIADCFTALQVTLSENELSYLEGPEA